MAIKRPTQSSSISVNMARGVPKAAIRPWFMTARRSSISARAKPARSCCPSDSSAGSRAPCLLALRPIDASSSATRFSMSDGPVRNPGFLLTGRAWRATMGGLGPSFEGAGCNEEREVSPAQRRPTGGTAPFLALLVIAFGTTVAMWSVGYLGRLPVVLLPSPLLLAFMLSCVPLGGFLFGRLTEANWTSGFAAGALSGLLNLFIFGSLLGGARPNEVVPSAIWWIPGSILVSALLAAVGTAVGRRQPLPGERPDRWWLGW
ncbi:MAG: hypothetical protein ACYTGV_19465, partial [Planctomycetota bacterium]